MCHILSGGAVKNSLERVMIETGLVYQFTLNSDEGQT